MRKILFRGKPLGKLHGKFIYGSLGVLDTDLCAIYHCFEFKDDEMELVYINTVGQYTGLTDKNGKEIYDGDIAYNYKLEDNVIIHWDNGTSGFVWTAIYEEYYRNRPLNSAISTSMAVIGNIHENPDLLNS